MESLPIRQLLSHHHARVQNASVAHTCAGPHHRVRPQVHLLSKDRLGGDHRGRVLHSPSGGTGVEQAGCAGEVQLGTIGNDGVPAGPPEVGGGDDAAGRQVIRQAAGPGRALAVDQRGLVGFLPVGDPPDLQGPVPVEWKLEVTGDFSNGGTHGPLSSNFPEACPWKCRGGPGGPCQSRIDGRSCRQAKGPPSIGIL